MSIVQNEANLYIQHKAETARLRKAVADLGKTLRAIAELRYSEHAPEPFDDALDLADAALAKHAPLIAECSETEKEG